ncbi:glycosyltransferase family 2 protein [Candidatus Thiosymbion oneisti]|uniref:glycosyltransferase family 2 protein n=1 Tax=Candidatus Thiosymbion oneisti TaxID=589554 RepID=UPI00105D2D26|nr:glycosyltransferase family A protein [Candidatus Thiosymbion oneisti]
MPEVTPPSGVSLSVIVPCFNAAETLGACLDALLEHSQVLPNEIIVVDDASQDRSVAVASRPGVELITAKINAGPGVTRNLGAARAGGDILVFVDADVAVAPDALGQLARHFAADADCTAVIGSYDSEPEAHNPVSQYRNLLHYYVHQHASEQASHFWTGLGAIRKSTFDAFGGFDTAEFNRVIEDVELGYRLRDAGYSIRLDRRVQGKHLRRWSFGSMARTDLFVRAIPWTWLVLARAEMPSDFSLGWGQRASVAMAWLLPSALLAALVWPEALLVMLAALGLFVGVNLDFFRFLHVRLGWARALAAVPLHWFYHFNSGLGFILGVIGCGWQRLKTRLRVRPSPR